MALHFVDTIQCPPDAKHLLSSIQDRDWLQSLSFLAIQEPFTSLHHPNFVQRGVFKHPLDVALHTPSLCSHFPCNKQTSDKAQL